MSLKIGAVQPPLRSVEEDPIEHTKRCIISLLEQQTGIDIFVLPELSPIGYSEDTFERYLDRPDTQEQIDLLLAETACKTNAFIAYGRIGRDKKTIQHCVINAQGELVTCYDKQLLCAYGDCAETKHFTAGTELCSFDCKGFRLGLLICVDMRNPTWSRRLALEHKVDAILQPAAFSRDLSFRTWKSFRETRAVENSIYWVGVNYAGNRYGNSAGVPPWVDEDHEPLVLGMQQGVLQVEISKAVLDDVRRTMPYYQLMLQEN